MADTSTESNSLIRMIREQVERMQESGGNNPLLELLSSFLSFFLGINDDSDAPDFEDLSDPAERAAAERQYNSSRRDVERTRHGDFRQSASRWTAAEVASSSAELIALREAAEAANGGATLQAINPVQGAYRISSPYGMRVHPTLHTEKMHTGVDFAPQPAGSKPAILAAMPGIIVGVGVRGGYGNMVEIMDIYGVKHRYAHLDSANVRVGQEVQQGEQIGIMGTTGRSTGVHLHYEQRDGNNQPRNPLPHVNLNGQAITAAPAATPADRPAAAPAAPAATPPKAPTAETPVQAAQREVQEMVDGGLKQIREARDHLQHATTAVMANLPRLPQLPNLFQRG